MASARSDHSPRPSSSAPSSTQSPIPQPPAALSNEDIEAVIKMATSARPNAEGRPLPNRDTRTQLFIGNLPYRVRWQDLKDLFRKAGTVLRADVSLGPDNRSRGYGTVLLATAEDAGRAVDMFNGYSWQTRTLEVRLDRLPPELDYSAAGNLNVVGMPSGSSSMPTMPVMRNMAVGVSGGLNNAYSGPSPLHSMQYIPPAPQAQPAPGPSSMLSLPPTAPSLNETFDYQGIYAPEPLHATVAKIAARILFVGNLPFQCQWQDLKDLFRQAGTVVRADVALGSDGRSRGFGTVMFATEADAERAVKNFNGFEYNGRALKVHLDKFAQMPQPALISATMSAISSGSPQLPNAFISQQQQNNMSGGYLGQSLSLPAQYSYNQQQQQQSPTSSTFEAYSFNQPSFALSPRISERQITSSHQSSSSNSTSRSNDDNSNNAPTATAASSVVPHPPPHPPHPQPLQGSAANTGPGATQEGNSNNPSSHRSHSHSHSGQNHPAHPGPISLPPLGSFVPMPHLSPGGLSPMHHPMSPMHMPGHPHVVAMTPHGLPPITPSMPPFSFLPQDSPQFQHHHQQHQHHQHQHQHPHQQHPQHPHQHQGQGQHNISSSTHPHSPTAGTPMMHPAHRMFAPFSPGMTMSPGAFWGRPGPGGHAGNPYLNPAVGSPVLMHAPPLSPGGMYGGGHGYHSGPGTPGMMGEEPTGYFPPIPSPHHLQQQQQQQQQQPSGYFPPVPVQMNAEPVPVPAQGHGQGHVAEALEKEIMRDTNNGSAASSTVDTTGSGSRDTGSSVAETTATRSSLATSWVSDEPVSVGVSPAGKTIPGSVSTGDVSSIMSLSSEDMSGSGGTQQQHENQQQTIQPPPRSQAMSAGANVPPHAPPALTHKTHSDQTGVHLRTRSATPSSSTMKPDWASGWAEPRNNGNNHNHSHTTSSVSASATASASASASTSTNAPQRRQYDWDIWALNAPPGTRLPPELDLDLDISERLRRFRDREWERSAAAHAAAAAGATAGGSSAASGTSSAGAGAGGAAATSTVASASATLTDAFSEFRLDPDPISAAARRARWGLDLAGQQFQSQSSRGRQGESRTVSGGSGSGSGGRGGSTSGGHGTPSTRGVGLGLPGAGSQCP